MSRYMFFHEDGVLYSENDVPQAVTYGDNFSFQYVLTPLEEHEEEISISTQDSWAMDYKLPVENLEWRLKEQDNWSPENPALVEFSVDTSFERIEEVENVDSETLEDAAPELLGQDYTSMSAEEISKAIGNEFSYSMRDSIDREKFLEQRKGVCNQFAELMAVARPEWIKHNGYACRDDIDISSREVDFVNHAWVADRQEKSIYDPTPVVEGHLEPGEVERGAHAYFLQIPQPAVELDGERIPKKINRLGESDTQNYRVEAKTE